MRSKDAIKYSLIIVLALMVGSNLISIFDRFEPRLNNLDFDNFVSVNERVKITVEVSFPCCNYNLDSYLVLYFADILTIKVKLWSRRPGVCLTLPITKWYNIFIKLPSSGAWKIECNNIIDFIYVS